MPDEILMSFRAQWPLSAGSPRPLNQYVFQVGLPTTGAESDGLVYVRLGHVSPPLLIGDKEVDTRTIEQYGGVLQVEDYGTFVMTQARAKELHELLSGFLSRKELGSGIAEGTSDA